MFRALWFDDLLDDFNKDSLIVSNLVDSAGDSGSMLEKFWILSEGRTTFLTTLWYLEIETPDWRFDVSADEVREVLAKRDPCLTKFAFL